MTLQNVVLGLGLAAMLGACDGDGGGGLSDADRGGPDALAGHSWTLEQSAGGIDFTTVFEFGATDLKVTNECSVGGESLTAAIEVPVQYRYTATVAETTRSGTDACFVEIARGSFDFELSGDKLIATSGESVIEFTSAGGNSGLYGDWTAELDGFVLTWSMGAGKIEAHATCPGTSEAPSVSAATEFVNHVDVLMADEDQVGDAAFSCSVSAMQGLMDYVFAGETLVLTFQGAETRLEAR
jgi:hypothetical protein